jgi:hypothetical protein
MYKCILYPGYVHREDYCYTLHLKEKRSFISSTISGLECYIDIDFEDVIEYVKRYEFHHVSLLTSPTEKIVRILENIRCKLLTTDDVESKYVIDLYKRGIANRFSEIIIKQNVFKESDKRLLKFVPKFSSNQNSSLVVKGLGFFPSYKGLEILEERNVCRDNFFLLKYIDYPYIYFYGNDGQYFTHNKYFVKLWSTPLNQQQLNNTYISRMKVLRNSIKKRVKCKFFG